jgi:cysteinyl-tRNA synthetase
MRVFNTLRRAMEEFAPLEHGVARMYTCGPTVYNYPHIGNYRAYVFEDLLRRHLKFSGFRVVQVMNLTDVDDKTIRGARESARPLREYTRTYSDAFFEDLKVLNIERAEHYPPATEHVPEMIALIERLLAKGVAYRSEDGSVYFSIAKFPAYGRLAHLDLAGLQAGARVSHDEYEKESLGDFALWKAWTEDDGDVAWDSPWGRGRPGWHIECSALGMKYLGESFDLHTGGVDNMFPHHENEIAQSEAATGKPFVKYWMHCAHLVVDGRKMSKSLGNFHTLRDVLSRGYHGREIRYVLLAAHYRQSLNFTFEALDAARAALGRLDDFAARLSDGAGSAPAGGSAPAWAREGHARFRGAMDDDLNTPEALAALFDMVREGHRALDASGADPRDLAAALALYHDTDRVLGVLVKPADAPDGEAEEWLRRRKAARAARDWKESDRIRERLALLGWEVRDTADGQVLRRKA